LEKEKKNLKKKIIAMFFITVFSLQKKARTRTTSSTGTKSNKRQKNWF